MKKKLDADCLGIILLSAFMDEFFPEETVSVPDTFTLFHYNGLPRSCPNNKVTAVSSSINFFAPDRPTYKTSLSLLPHKPDFSCEEKKIHYCFRRVVNAGVPTPYPQFWDNVQYMFSSVYCIFYKYNNYYFDKVKDLSYSQIIVFEM